MEELQTASKDELHEDNISAQEKLNLRRESRRRKILENAKNRLERLNGRGSGDTAPKLEEQHCDFSDPEVEPDIIPRRELLNQYAGTRTATADFNDLFSASSADVSPQQKQNVLVRCRLHILLAVLIAYALTFLTSLGNVGCNSVFVPAGIFIVLELTYFRKQRQNNPIINILITISGLNSQKASRILHLFTTIQGLIVDIGVFVFFFCILTCTFVNINDKFANLAVIK